MNRGFDLGNRQSRTQIALLLRSLDQNQACHLAQLSKEEQQRFQQATVLSEYCFQE